VVDESEGSKTVDITLDGPGGQPIVARLQFQYVPAERRIAYHTLDNPVLDSNGEYRFEDEGTSTLIVYHQTTQMLQQLPVPDGVVKQVIRSIFIAQLEGLRSTLHIPNGRQSSGEDETSSLLF
jgi:hypothetical protein